MCGKRVFEGSAAYVCEHSQADKKPCKFKINKVILQQPIDREQAARLLSKGKTDLLQEFISAKSGRPFPAYLVMDEEGKVTFDFPPREAETTKQPGEVMPGRPSATGQRQVDQEVPPAPGDGSGRLGLHAAQLPAGDVGISSLAPGGAAAAAGVGDNCSGMTFAPTCASWAGTI